MLVFRIFLLVLLQFGSTQLWAEIKCDRHDKTPLSNNQTKAPVQFRTLDEIKSLRIMGFNVENLVNYVGKFEHISSTEMRPVLGRTTKPKAKPNYKIDWIEQIYLEVLPDISILTEVDKLSSLDNFFNRDKLKGLYRRFLIEGNDPRDIDIGVVIKSDLPFKVEYKSSKDRMWYDPVEKKEVPLFSRDLPYMLLSIEGSGKPFLIVLGMHSKSQRDRPGDPNSTIWRQAQYKGTREIMDELSALYPGVGMILVGDANVDVTSSPDIEPLRGNTKSVFDLLPKKMDPQDRVTHSYFPPQGAAHYAQMDDARVTRELFDKVVNAYVYRYVNKNGHVMPIPKSFGERQKLPSDHYPVVTEISTSGMWPE